MDDDIAADIERRTKELRGWMLKGTRPRRVIYLATALHDIMSQNPDWEYTPAREVLDEFMGMVESGKMRVAIAIFDAEEIEDVTNGDRAAVGG